jgi:hypothetical protein
MIQTRVNLTPRMFAERERVLLEHGSLLASTFLYESGVCGLRLKNELGELVMLPYQGQQIWSARFLNRDLTMRSMFDTPRPTECYLDTYGGFLLHCGMTAMGVPGEGDTHPLHGELPNAPYREAFLVVGEDDRGDYLGLGGHYRHTVAFQHDYLASPLVKVYAGSAKFRVVLELENLKNTEMAFMYLAHVNFLPIDHGRLVYSAPAAPAHVRVRRSIPSHVRPKEGYEAFLEELARQPERHHVLAPGLMFDPEVVFFIDYQADHEGWAHSLQLHPGGSADYIAHKPEELDKGIRWICRTPDQDALGLVLPATAEPEGYGAEKAKGNLKTLPAGGVFRCELEIGALTPDEARRVETTIAAILEGAPQG